MELCTFYQIFDYFLFCPNSYTDNICRFRCKIREHISVSSVMPSRKHLLNIQGCCDPSLQRLHVDLAHLASIHRQDNYRLDRQSIVSVAGPILIRFP